MNPQIKVRYYQQPDMPSFIRKQVAHEAPYNAYLWYLAPYAFTLRHAVTGMFAAFIIVGLALSIFSSAARWIFAAVMILYMTFAVIAGVQQALRYREPRHAVFAPFAFLVYHFLHGAGVLIGFAKLAAGTAPVQRKHEPWPGAGRFRAWPPGRSAGEATPKPLSRR